MGKILNALKTANGEIPELVLQCLEDVREAPSTRVIEARQFNGRRAATYVVEPIFEKSLVLQLPQREDDYDARGREAEGSSEAPAMADLVETPEKPAVRQVSLRISDSSPLRSTTREDRRAAEQYRIIRTRIFHQLPGSSITVIASPGMGDGKTVTAVNLAAALAHKSEDKVILIDADLRLSKVHERLGIPKSPGLAEVLSGACALEDAVYRVEQSPN